MTEIYAYAGEEVVCPRGHAIGKIARNLYRDEVVPGDAISGLRVPKGSCYPPCRCGEHFTATWSRSRKGCFRFREGWRR